MNNHIIKIQRYYRTHLIKRKLYILKQYNLKNKNEIIFDNFTKIIRGVDIIKATKNVINIFNSIYKPIINITPHVILTAYLINNFPIELLGTMKDRHPIDIQLLEWSNKLIDFLDNYENSTFIDFKKIHNYMNNYKIIFDYWKEIDKNRTIQNIIVSYYNRMKHLEYIKNEELEPNQKEIIINTLVKESNDLLKQIMYIDPVFNIEYIQQNYELVYDNIKKGMEQILHTVSKSFKVSYLEMLIEEFGKSNRKIIFDLILETNQRIGDIAPEKFKASIIKKFHTYHYTKLLLKDNWSEELNDYLAFTVDTVTIFSAPEDDKDNIKWKSDMKTLTSSDFLVSLPIILVEINNKIDKLYSIFNKII
jgi:hypothetical protein